MKHEFVILLLWLIAIAATFLMLKEQGTFTRLAPVYAICVIGSVVTVRRARSVAGR